MSSTFTEIVRSLKVDKQNPGERGFDAKNIITLADRLRRNALTPPPTLWSRFVLWLRRMWHSLFHGKEH